MTDYVPPLRDIRFVLEQLVDLPGLCKLGAFGHVDPDTVFELIKESGRFTAGVLGPLNRVGDTVGCALDSAGNVTTPPGFNDAYRRYIEAGWGAVPFAPEFGGGGFPFPQDSGGDWIGGGSSDGGWSDGGGSQGDGFNTGGSF